jgi:hypothetical protein
MRCAALIEAITLFPYGLRSYLRPASRRSFKALGVFLVSSHADREVLSITMSGFSLVQE